MVQAPRRPLILYVEDEADLALAVGELLELEGFATVLARHGRQALTLLEGGLEPRAIISDMMMPELDGFGLLAALRERGGERPPVLAVSAFDPYLQSARQAGAAAVLAKPFRPGELIATVRRLLAGGAPALAPERPPLEDEPRRLEAVLRLGMEGRSPGGRLDAFAARVARAFDAPLCLVSTVGQTRQYRHACSTGPDPAAAAGAPRDDSFCTHAVAARAALVVQDAAANPFFRDNRFVRERGLRFYAGVPLFAQRGEAVGTLCLLDTTPRGFGLFDLELLGTLARRVVAELERRERVGPGAPPSALRDLDAWDEDWDVLGRTTFEEALRIETLRGAERGWALAVGVARVGGADPAAAVETLKAAIPEAHLGRLGSAQLGVAAPRLEAAALRGALERTAGVEAVATAGSAGPGGADALLAALEARVG